MGKINVLDPQIANLIAAGEVVDRPASVVKEMLENSIDAGAKNVTVEIKRGGASFIRVSDDGCGMSREDVPVCIKRHATSKIKDAGDLDGIMTLGFRGEALAAIGSVSTMRIMTKPHGEKMGTLLFSEAGEVKQFTETGCMDGTTIIVENLFANVPARRKFLKKDSSEAMAVTAVVEKIALSRPDLAFRFISDGNLRFATAGDNNLKNCIYAVLGRDFASRLTPVDALTEGIEVKGFIGSPENIRANRNYQNFFINGRYVKSRTAMAALEQAFSSYIPSDKFPVCVLSINIHPAYVDVNVHPAKLEVKFSNEQLIFDAVYSAVRGALTQKLSRPDLVLKTKSEATRENRILGAFLPLRDGNSPSPGKGEQLTLGGIPRASTAGEPCPAPFTAPQNDGGEFSVPKLDSSYRPQVQPSDTETVPLPLSVDNGTESTEIKTSSADLRASDDDDDPLMRLTTPVGNASSKRPKSSSHTAEFSGASQTTRSTQHYSVSQNHPQENDGISAEKHTPDTQITSQSQKNPASAVTQKIPAAQNSSVSNINRASAESIAVPQYKMFGEAFNSYIMVETDGKLLMIDKHAAHERILFEDMKKNLHTGNSAAQLLFLPIDISLSPNELSAALEYRNELYACGYAFEQTKDGKGIQVTQIPAFLTTDTAEDMLVTICGRLADGTGTVNNTRTEFYEQALYQASCKAAIKAGRIYDEAHLKWICERVISNPEIRFCPHGRPVAFELTKNDIEHRFKRS